MLISIPICFFPTKKLLLDDDQAFTQSILLKINYKNTIVFNSSKMALNFLLYEYQQTYKKSDLLTLDHAIESNLTQKVVNINTEKLKQVLANFQYQDISVLLIDYHMPELSGLDFLKEISYLPIKKVLITAEKDSEVAIYAFNQGLVDAYIRKDESNFIEKLQHTISHLEWKYFVELSHVVSGIPDLAFLKNKNFVSIFKDFIERNRIVSFCLTDMQGSFIAYTQQGKEKHFILRNKIQLQALSNLAKEDGGSIEVINQLEQGKVIPFFESKEFWQIPASDWGGYLYPAQEIIDDAMLVWTII